MKKNSVVIANVYTGTGHYSKVSFEVDLWHQAQAVLFFKYKSNENVLPADKRTITKIEFNFDHG